MKLRSNERGELNVLVVPVVLLCLLLVAALIFAVWAFQGRQDYKNNADQKISVAVAANTKKVQAADAKQYAEAAKSPLKQYVGPDAYGSVHVSYPKTWSAYVDTSDDSTPLNAYFHDNYVPSSSDSDDSGAPAVTYNLRVTVVDTSYDEVAGQYTDQVKQGQVTAAPYSLPKVPKVIGMHLSGKIFSDSDHPNQTGDMIILPLRDKTLQIWTESPSYLADFNTYILPNLSFSP